MHQVLSTSMRLLCVFVGLSAHAGRRRLGNGQANQTQRRLRATQIISVSALSEPEMQSRGGPPEGSHFIAKPVDLGWLKGYLLGLMTPQAWV